jgi:hypothetical protein
MHLVFDLGGILAAHGWSVLQEDHEVDLPINWQIGFINHFPHGVGT